MTEGKWTITGSESKQYVYLSTRTGQTGERVKDCKGGVLKCDIVMVTIMWHKETRLVSQTTVVNGKEKWEGVREGCVSV